MPTGVPLPTPSAFSPFATRDDLVVEVGKGDRRAVVLRLALEVVGDPVATPGLDVPVDAVEADVQRPAEEPFRVRRLPLEQRLERLEPRHALARLPRPELLERTS